MLKGMNPNPSVDLGLTKGVPLRPPCVTFRARYFSSDLESLMRSNPKKLRFCQSEGKEPCSEGKPFEVNAMMKLLTRILSPSKKSWCISPFLGHFYFRLVYIVFILFNLSTESSKARIFPLSAAFTLCHFVNHSRYIFFDQWMRTRVIDILFRPNVLWFNDLCSPSPHRILPCTPLCPSLGLVHCPKTTFYG